MRWAFCLATNVHNATEKTHLVTGGMCLYPVRFLIRKKKTKKQIKTK